MNKLTNTILTKVADLAQTTSVIANAADKLLNHVLLKEDVAAWCFTHRNSCWPCVNGKKSCVRCCGLSCRRQRYDC